MTCTSTTLFPFRILLVYYLTGLNHVGPVVFTSSSKGRRMLLFDIESDELFLDALLFELFVVLEITRGAAPILEAMEVEEDCFLTGFNIA